MNISAVATFLGLAFLIASSFARAESFQQEWAAVPDADSYEYEISETLFFDGDSLVRQGRETKPRISTDLKPGVYHFRVRAVDSKGAAGKWSAPIRGVVKATPPLLRSPQKNESIEVSGETTPISFEWTTVAGAQDYEIKLQSLGADKSAQKKLVISPIAVFDGLKPGAWQVQVTARVNGQILAQTESVPFSVVKKTLPRPQFLHPLENDGLTAHEMIQVRWTRHVPGSLSRVICTRVGGPVVSREDVSNASRTWIEGLPPGRYQITIQDFLNNSTESAEQSITVVIEDDPMGYHSRYLGATLRFLSLTPQFGFSSIRNDQLSNSPEWNSRVSDDGGSPHLFFEPRLQSKVWNQWGLESFFRIASKENYFLPDRMSGKLTSSAIVDYTLAAGPTYKIDPWGPTKVLLLKALLSYHRLGQIQNLRQNNGPTKEDDTFGILGAIAAAELRWGGWNSRYDLIGEARVSIPLLTDSGPIFGRGSVLPLPSLNLQAFARRKISEDVRFFIGGEMDLEYLSIGEKPTSLAPQTERTADTQFRRFSYGPKLGFEWDL